MSQSDKYSGVHDSPDGYIDDSVATTEIQAWGYNWKIIPAKVKTITLSYSPTARVWLAETRVNGQPDPIMQRLFGTHILPTAFDGHARGFTVLNAIRDLNPDALVIAR